MVFGVLGENIMPPLCADWTSTSFAAFVCLHRTCLPLIKTRKNINYFISSKFNLLFIEFHNHCVAQITLSHHQFLENFCLLYQLKYVLVISNIFNLFLSLKIGKGWIKLAKAEHTNISGICVYQRNNIETHSSTKCSANKPIFKILFPNTIFHTKAWILTEQ